MGASSSSHAAPCIRVFSHRGASGDFLLDGSNPLPTKSAIRALMDRGISAFDLDLFSTTDGTVFVAHPASLQHVSSDPSSMRASIIKDLCPALLQAIELLKLAQQESNLTLALDLKGLERHPQRHTEQLLWLAEQIKKRGLDERVWLWADTPEIARRLRGGTPWKSTLRLVKPVRDRLLDGPRREGAPFDCTSQLANGDDSLFVMLGPSQRCATSALLAPVWASSVWGASGSWAHTMYSSARRGRTHLPVDTGAAGLLVWVVDDEADLPRLLELGVRHIISNAPLRLQTAANALCRPAGQPLSATS
jgi:glycerophosphoryl diester phosphodiesterase